MHIEILIEDSSGEALMQVLLPKLIGEQGCPHTWRLHSYKGVGRIPKGLGDSSCKSDPKKRILLSRLPQLLCGYANTLGIDAVVVILDADKRNCKDFLAELKQIAQKRAPANTMFRLAIEEIEAWYLGDRKALMSAYPKAKTRALNDYKQDSVCGTWELLADTVHPGGSSEIKKAGWPLPGQVKHEWARKIGPFMDPENNLSQSFQKLRNGLRKLVSIEQANLV